MRLSKLQRRLVLVAKRRHPAPPVLGGKCSLAQVSQRMHILQLRETLWDKCTARFWRISALRLPSSTRYKKGYG